MVTYSDRLPLAEWIEPFPESIMVTPRSVSNGVRSLSDISHATQCDEVLDALIARKRYPLEQRLSELYELGLDEESDEDPMVLNSLRTCAFFFVENTHPFGPPRIALGPDGILSSEWMLGQYAIAIDFLPYNRVRFACISTQVDNCAQPAFIEDTGEQHKALIAIRQFLHEQSD